MKFGGAAVHDAEALQHVAQIVARRQAPTVVVTSAMGGVTDELIEAVQQASTGDDVAHPVVEKLRTRHLLALATLSPNDLQASDELDAVFATLHRVLQGISFISHVSPRLHDLVLSTGERLAAPLLAAALRASGCKAAAVDAKQAGLRTLGPYGDAMPDEEGIRTSVKEGLQPLLDQGVMPVVTGFYGVNADGCATLFGRGGSDYVAALLARALDADVVELWKDVSGFMSADPRVVPSARLIPHLSYEAAAELARVGAKVLHPRCVDPLRLSGIPIAIRSLVDPTAQGTVIGSMANPTQGCAVTVKDGLVAIVHRLRGDESVTDRMANLHDLWGTPVMTWASTNEVVVLVNNSAAEENGKRARRQGELCDVLDDMLLICIAGDGAAARTDMPALLLRALQRENVPVLSMQRDASGFVIKMAARTPHPKVAMEAIHRLILEEEVVEVLV